MIISSANMDKTIKLSESSPTPPVILLSAINYNGSGSWLDQSGNNNNADLENGTITKNSIGNGIVLDGSTSWTFPNVAVGNAWTINVWYKQTTNVSGSIGIVTQSQSSISSMNIMLGYFGSNTIIPSFCNNNIWYNSSANISLTNNNWTNIQVTWDGTNMNTYLNGVLFNSSIINSSSVDGGTAYIIGRCWNNTNYVTGEIGEVRIYNIALTESQVITDYLNSRDTFITELPIDIVINTPIKFYNLSFTVNQDNSYSLVPTQVDGLQAWYDGADSSTFVSNNNNNTINSWMDKSGNNYIANVNDPSNLPVSESTGGIFFNGNSQYFNLPDNVIPYNDSSYTMIVVFNSTNNGGLITGANGNWYTTGGVNSIDISSNLVHNYWSDDDIATSNTIQSGINIVYVDYFTGSNRNLILNIQNTNTNIPATRVQPNNNNTIGYSTYSGYLNGTIYEILIYNRTLNNNEKELLEGYLTWKWNITNYLPWTHNYKFREPSSMPTYKKDPLSYAGIVSWYDCGDPYWLALTPENNVNTIYDKNNDRNDLNYVSTNLPTFVNGSGIVFDGTMYFEAMPFVQNLDQFTIYVVFNQSTPTDNAGILGFYVDNDTDADCMSFNTGSGTSNFNVTNTNFDVSSTNTTTSTNIYCIICDEGTIKIYCNGILNGVTTISTSNGTSANLIVGSRYINGEAVNGLIGTLKDIIIYSTNQNDETRQELEGYLANKWRVQLNLPSNHPYRYYPPGVNIKTLDPLTHNPTDRWFDGEDMTFFDLPDLKWYDKSFKEGIGLYTGTSINIDTSIIQGMNSIQFLGDDNYFEDTLNINSAYYTISFVISMDSTVVENGRILSLYNTGFNDYDNTSSIGIGQYGSNNSNQIALYYNSTNSTPITIEFNTFNIISYFIDGITGNVYTYLNGVLEATDNLNITIATTKLTIGNAWTGYINEVVLYPYVIKNDMRQILEGYLAWKWQLQSLLPNNHPYYNLPPITSIPTFKPTQIHGLDIWNDAYSLIDYNYQDGQSITNWFNSNPTNQYIGSSNGTNPLFSRWGFNGQPTVTYTPGNYTILKDPNTNKLYSTDKWTFMSVSRYTTGTRGRVFSSGAGAGNSLIIGYWNNWKNVLYMNGQWLNNPGWPGSYSPGDTNWDNYVFTKNSNNSVQFYNYELNLNQYNQTTIYQLNGLAYNYEDSCDCQISEVLVYSNTLPMGYIKKIQGYLAWKWGLQYNLSIDHPYKFEIPQVEETQFTINLIGWESTVPISTLYIFDTVSSELLTQTLSIYGNSTTGYYAKFIYKFPQAQNYLTISDTNNMSGKINYPITSPLIVTPDLILDVVPTDKVNNWGYFNVAKTYSFSLATFYQGISTNFNNYYSTLNVYYADNELLSNITLIGPATVSEDGTETSFTFTYDPTVITSTTLYFCFSYETTPTPYASAISSVYIFFNKTSLNFTLDHYNYYNNYTITTNLPSQINFTGYTNPLHVYYSKDDPTYSGNVYANQTYITNVLLYNYSSGYFTLTFPSPDTGKYYLTISNIDQYGTRTDNDMNVNIALPIYVNLININLNVNFGFYQAINPFIATLGTYNNSPYPFSTIRIFYSTVVATQDSDLTELPDSPYIITIPNQRTAKFNFDNSTLLYPSVYFYFTASTDQVPPLDSFTYNQVSFYDKTTINFTLDHYDNSSPNYTLTATYWDSILNIFSPLKVYILDSRQSSINYPPIMVTLTSSDTDTYTGTFTFDFNFLDAGTYYITLSDSNLSSSEINYTISTPITVTLPIPHFILQNSQFTNTQTTTTPPFDISTVPDLILWLDSSDLTTIVQNETNITQWNDKSSSMNVFNTTSGSPIYANNTQGNGIAFSATTQDVMISANQINASQNATLFYVAQTNNNNNWEYVIVCPNQNNGDYSIRYINNTYQSGGILASYNINGVPYAGTDYTQNHMIDGQMTAVNDYFTLSSSFNSYYFDGNIYEIIIVNRQLSQVETQLIEGYLAWKWNIQSNLPSNHPFIGFNPTVSMPSIIHQKFLPTQLPSLELWLDANDSSTIQKTNNIITQWNDKSGNSKNATAVGLPIYGSDFGIVLDGSSSFTLLDETLPYSDSSYSYFIVAKVTTSGNYKLIGNSSFGILTNSTNNIITNWDSNDLTSINTINTNKLFLTESLYQSTENRSIYINDNFDSTDIPGIRDQTETNNVIGTSLIGEIYEIVVFSDNLNDFQRQQMEGYLINKWSIKLNIPTNIPDLCFWLDGSDPLGNGVTLADGTQIATWVDKSGNNYNFNVWTGYPTYRHNLFGSYSGLDFSGQNIGIIGGINYTNNCSFAMVINIQQNISTWGRFLSINNRDVNLCIGRYSNNDQLDIEISGTHFQIDFDSNINYNKELILIGSITNGVSLNLNITTSGTTTNFTNTYAVNSNFDGWYNVYLGTDESQETCKSYIRDVIFYNRDLTQDEQNTLLYYLQNKSTIGNFPYLKIPPPILYRTNIVQIPTFFSPTQISNLSLWLDGKDLSSVTLSGTDVTLWNDKSGNNNNATAVSTPQWLPTYGISFDGTSSYFTLPDNTLPSDDNSYSYFIVANFANLGGNFGLISGGDQTNDNDEFSLKTNSTNNLVTTWYNNDLSTNYEYSINTPVLIESVYTSGGDRIFYINTKLDSSDTPGTRTQTNNNNVVGSTITGELMKGNIYEIIVYNSVLTIQQRQEVESYLAHKWNVLIYPDQIPNLTNWLDASDTNTLYQDQNGTIPVTNTSQPIKYVSDKSSNHYNLNSNGNASSYDTLNGLPVIHLPGYTNLSTIEQIPKSKNVTVFWAGAFNSQYYNSVWSHSNGNLGAQDVAIRMYDWTNSVNFGSYDYTNCLLPINYGVPVIYWATMENGVIMKASRVNLDGSFDTISYNKPSLQWQAGLANIHLNCQSSDGLIAYANSYLYENLYYQRVLTSSEINTIVHYLSEKWSITLPNNFVATLNTPSNSISKNLNIQKIPLKIPLKIPQKISENIVKNIQENIPQKLNVFTSNNGLITLTLSTYYPKIYLYSGPTDKSYYNLTAINDPITGNNLYIVDPVSKSITFKCDTTNIIYFYASLQLNYTSISGMSLPFIYIDQNSINKSLTFNNNTSDCTITLNNYNPILLNIPLNILAIQNNNTYININQILSLTSINNSLTDYTGTFNYSFLPFNTYSIILTDSYDLLTNIPNGNICLTIPNNIYTFTLNMSSPSNIYDGTNNIELDFSIDSLPPTLVVSNLISNGNISFNNILLPNNPKTLIINQININIYKFQNNGFTLWLDAMDVSTITHDNNNIVSQWNDKSGSDSNGTQTETLYKPSYNNFNKGIWFKGYAFGVNQQYLNLPFNTFNNTNYYTCSFVFTHNGNDTYIISKQHDGINTYSQILLYGSGQYFRWMPRNGVYLDQYVGFTQGTKYLMTFTYDGNTYRLWKNGVLVNTTTSASGAILDDLNVTTCTMGSWHAPSVGDQNVNIQIHEFIFNETFLYDCEIQKIEAYLSNKWSISNTSNPYIDDTIVFLPNSVTENENINFSTTDNSISIDTTINNVNINPTLTSDNDRSSQYYTITFDNWNSNITSVYLYIGTNNKFYNQTLLRECSVNSDNNGYYIILDLNTNILENNTYYLSIRDINSNIFDFNLRVNDPNNYLTINNTDFITLSTSPTTCILNQDNSITITFSFSNIIPAMIYLYTCPTIYTTGNIGTGPTDLSVLTTLTVSNLTNNEATVNINPTNLPIYILASSYTGFTGFYGYSNVLTLASSLLLKKSPIKYLTGKIDAINNYSIDLQDTYKNIQVNNSNIVIKHTINNNNNIIFLYDSGYESKVTFNIINSVSKEIYETIEVTFT